MADQKISALPDGSPPQDTDEFVVARTGNNFKLAWSALKAAFTLAPPVDLQGTDPAQPVLTLRADPAQTEHIFRVYDDAGDLAVDVDSNGILDTRRVVVQDPPDTGTPGDGTLTLFPGHFFVAENGTDRPISIRTTSGINEYFVVRESAGPQLVEINMPNDTSVPLLIYQSATPTADMIQVWDNAFNVTLFYVTKDGAVASQAGLGVFGVTPPAAQPAEPTTMNEVVAILQGAGLSA